MIADTSVVYAAAVRGDAAHTTCAALLKGGPFVVPAPVVVETDWVSHARGAASASLSLLRSVEDGSVEVVDLVPADYGRVATLRDQYPTLGLDFVDAAIIAVAERLRDGAIATLDRRHFSVVRPAHVRAFTLLP